MGGRVARDMIKHVVIWKLRGPSAEDKRSQAERVQARLRTLLGKVPGLLSIEVGIARAPSEAETGDVVLTSTHESWEALAAYQKHPEHLDAAKLIGELRTERRVVDYES